MSNIQDGVSFRMNEQEFQAELSRIQRERKAINEPWMKSTHRRNLTPIANAMKSNSKSTRIAKMIGITTAKSKSPSYGAKVGVIKNDATLFPKFSAPAKASVIEYGTDERFRGIRAGSIVVGAISTGEMPSVPFLRPAWDNNVNGYMKRTEDAIVHKIEKEGD